MDGNASQSPFVTHPQNAAEARTFQQQQTPASLSYPVGGAGHPTPPLSEKDGSQAPQAKSDVNGQHATGNGVVPNTPGDTPSNAQAQQGGVSGIVPTLQ